MQRATKKPHFRLLCPICGNNVYGTAISHERHRDNCLKRKHAGQLAREEARKAAANVRRGPVR